ncbi:MAG: hypothetical protein JSW61_04475 [Candidatus Thorarchaeota archaeon]|nr:MAG: hypothetical protein JSW61_04475 [Candidatus Thorarchaeota archaeon]
MTQRNNLASADMYSLQSGQMAPSTKVTVTVFTSKTCAFCSKALELAREVASDISCYEGPVEVVESRIDERPELVEQLEILALPTILVGQSRLIGLPNQGDIEELVHMSMLNSRIAEYNLP